MYSCSVSIKTKHSHNFISYLFLTPIVKVWIMINKSKIARKTNWSASPSNVHKRLAHKITVLELKETTGLIKVNLSFRSSHFTDRETKNQVGKLPPERG